MTLRNIPTLFLILVFGACGAFTSRASANEDFTPFLAEALNDSVNVRAGQSANFEQLCQLKTGEEVMVVDQSYGWYKIQLPPTAKSFVSRNYVQFLGQGAGGVTGGRVNIRAGAGTHHTILGQLLKGEQIYIREDLKEWYRIVPVAKSYGWVAEQFLTLKSKDTTAYEEKLSSRSFVKEKNPVIRKGSIPVKKKDIQLAQVKSEIKERNDIAVIGYEEVEIEGKSEAKSWPERKNFTGFKHDTDFAKVDVEKFVVPEKKKVKKPVERKKVSAKRIRKKKEDNLKKIQKVQKKKKVEKRATGITSFTGYVEAYDDNDDGIYYKLVESGKPVCYVQGVNHMLGRFLHNQVTVEGTFSENVRAQYDYPVITIVKVRLML